MDRAGVVGLGDMGSGLAKNLIANGFPTVGFDLAETRLRAFEAMGGTAAGSVAEVGREADVVFVMVMDGAQANAVILGEGGLVGSMRPGGAVILSATIRPSEARAIGAGMDGSGIGFVDSPVSGGYPGAQEGTLTLMVAAPEAVLDRCEPALRAVSRTVHRVGARAGDGQAVKACLQSLIGAIFAASFEATALAAKAGIAGEVLQRVVASTGAGCGITDAAIGHVIDRRFEGTGSRIATMHKDLTIVLELAAELRVPMHAAASAMQLFHAGRAKYPDGDNQVVARVIEDIVGVELHR